MLRDRQPIYKGTIVLRRLEDQQIEKDEVQNLWKEHRFSDGLRLRERRSACGSAG